MLKSADNHKQTFQATYGWLSYLKEPLMAWMKGAKARPIKENYTHRVTAKDCVILHTTASAAATSMYRWFSNPNAQASSHFHVDFDGNIEQYMDSAHMSWANSAANPRSITIETQGNGSEPWTNAQIVAIVQIIQWARSVHKGIPLRQMNSSARSEKGIGWHRLGVHGNFPKTGILRGRTQRGTGESWSSAYGKVCPGDDRIKQIPGIIRQAGGTSTKPKDWFSMATKADLRQIVREENRIASWAYRGKNENWDAYAYQRETYRLLEDLAATVGKKVWSYKNHLSDTDIYAFVRATNRAATATQGEIDGLMKALEQISQGREVNLAEVRQAAQEGVAKAVQDLEADVTLSVNAGEIG